MSVAVSVHKKETVERNWALDTLRHYLDRPRADGIVALSRAVCDMTGCHAGIDVNEMAELVFGVLVEGGSDARRHTCKPIPTKGRSQAEIGVAIAWTLQQLEEETSLGRQEIDE